MSVCSTVRHFRLGPIVKENLALVSIQLPPTARMDGVLGVNFLREFRTTFHFVEGLIEFAES